MGRSEEGHVTIPWVSCAAAFPRQYQPSRTPLLLSSMKKDILDVSSTREPPGMTQGPHKRAKQFYAMLRAVVVVGLVGWLFTRGARRYELLPLCCCLFSSADLLSIADRNARWVSSLLRPHHPTTTATYPAALLLPSKYPVCRTVRVGPASISSMVAHAGAECPSIEHPSRCLCRHTAAASRAY